MRALSLLCSIVAIHSMAWSNPLQDLLANYNIQIAEDQVCRIPAGTALPLSVKIAHPLLSIHGADSLGLSLATDLYIRGIDFAVSLDGETWAPLELALTPAIQRCSVSVDAQSVQLSLSE
ncbi:MAG: hypothetical protein ACOYKZ_07175 [Chlamydiia bacterium]